MGGVTFNGAIWIIGGHDFSGPLNDVWSSTNGTSWTQVLPLATPGVDRFSGRYDFQTLVHDSKLWVIGGSDGTNFLNDVWSSPDGSTWTRVLAPAATPVAGQFPARTGHGGMVHNGYLWVVGGYNGSNFNDTWRSTDGVTWTQVNPGGAASSTLFSARRTFGSAVLNGNLVVMGGYDSNGLNDTWFSPDGTSWTRMDTSSFPQRWLPAATAFDSRLWFIGGQFGGRHSNVHVSFDGISWTQATNGQFPSRDGAVALGHNNKLWVIGGFSGTAYFNDVWYSP